MDKQRLLNDSTINFSGFLKMIKVENEYDDSIKLPINLMMIIYFFSKMKMKMNMKIKIDETT